MLNEYNPLEGRKPLKLHCLITLHQPLSHIAETTGNEASLKTMTLLDLEGIRAEVPIYSGNAQRNGVMGRRSGIASLFDALNIKVNAATHQTFYAGGYGGSAQNDLDWETKVRQFFPYLSLLGTDVPEGVLGLKKPQMIPGRIAIGDAYLVCYESVKYLYEQFSPLVPEKCLESIAQIVAAERAYQDARVNAWLTGEKDKSAALRNKLEQLKQTWIPYLQQELRGATEWMTLRTKVRAASTKSPELARHLLPVAPQIEELVDEKNEGKKKKQAPKKPKATGQMIASSWVVQAGAQFYSRWCSTGQGITTLEEGALVDALLKFSQTPYLGGQAATGCGLCALDFWYQAGEETGQWLTVTPGHVQQLSPRAQDAHERYRAVLDTYREYLDELKAGESGESNELRQMLLGA